MLQLLLILIQEDWLTASARPILLTQAIVGTIALIGLVAVLKRFLSVEFPDAMKSVNDRLDTLHEDFKSLEGEFRQKSLEMERLKERVDNLSRRHDVLESIISRTK